MSKVLLKATEQGIPMDLETMIFKTHDNDWMHQPRKFNNPYGVSVCVQSLTVHYLLTVHFNIYDMYIYIYIMFEICGSSWFSVS